MSTLLDSERAPDLGVLMSAAEAAAHADLLSGRVSARWMRERAWRKVKLGHSTVAWDFEDARAWLYRRRGVENS